MSEIKEPSRKTKKLCAFTLAEVLITLAIIGVVAALTIPTVVAKYQKKQYYTQFMKVYNTLSEALSLAQAENGPYKSWGGAQVVGVSSTYADYTQSINSFLIPHLKIAKMCETASNCGISDDIKVYSLNDPEDNGSSYTEVFNKFDKDPDEDEALTGILFLLSDSSLVTLAYSDREIEFNIDTNGIKGPNVLGRDIFFLTSAKKNGILTLDGAGRHAQTFPPGYFDTSSTYTNCTTKFESDGYNCAIRLLVEGKMDY